MANVLTRTIPRRWVQRLLTLFLLLFLAAVVGSLVVVNRLSSDLPSLEKLRNIQPSEKTVILAANGDTLQEFYSQNRTVVPLERIPAHLQDAVVSIEDRRFYDHYGIDLKRLVKIVLDNVLGRGRPGASTLTMQLARNLFLTQEKTYSRKFSEMILAVQIEQIYTKDEILAMYLNQIYLGKGTYGVQAAARIFFGKDVWDLEPSETSMIAGMIQLPERYSPFDHLDMAYRRRAIVLQSMVAAGKLTQPQAETFAATEVTVVNPDASPVIAGFAAYYVEEVRKHLEQTYGADRLYTEGLRVWTTLVSKQYSGGRQSAPPTLLQTHTPSASSPLTCQSSSSPTRTSRASSPPRNRNCLNCCAVTGMRFSKETSPSNQYGLTITTSMPVVWMFISPNFVNCLKTIPESKSSTFTVKDISLSPLTVKKSPKNKTTPLCLKKEASQMGCFFFVYTSPLFNKINCPIQLFPFSLYL